MLRFIILFRNGKYGFLYILGKWIGQINHFWFVNELDLEEMRIIFRRLSDK